MATKEWRFKGDFSTRSFANPKQVLTFTPFDVTGEYEEQVVSQGILEAGAGTWEDVTLGAIATAKLTELRIDEATNVRLNGSLVIANVTIMTLAADITQLELQRHASTSPAYWIQFLD